MMARQEAIKFSYRDFLYLPDDGKTYQIIDGVLYMVPPPVPYHQIISMNLEFIMTSYVKAEDLGLVLSAPCAVVLSKEDVVQPDIFFTSRERLNIVTKKNIQGAPDLVVEILSPRTRKIDRVLKRELYSKFGVKEYWIVDPDTKNIEVLVHGEKGYRTFGIFGRDSSFHSPLLKGLVVDLRKVF